MPAFKNVYLSVEQAAPYEALDADLVIDQYADMGPFGRNLKRPGKMRRGCLAGSALRHDSVSRRHGFVDGRAI